VSGESGLARLVADVPDPELPAVTIGDLGILRGVEMRNGQVRVSITPTYSGCPALAHIAAEVRNRLRRAGYRDAEVHTVLTPPWTTDWITDVGRRKLAAAGIAPPLPAPARRCPVPITLGPPERRVRCPRCGSTDTQLRSRFAATACKALYWCASCTEPFEYVKEI
jgi:ring-1,2-phenylacetyl-CoA epoxidase subunit PaaD